jgi:hypothetical protein
MARAATAKRKTTVTKTRAASVTTKRGGRPVGSKNKAVATPATRRSSARAAPASRRPAAKTPRSAVASRRVAAPKKVAAAPKMNKADLEAHVVKLERTIIRLRLQMKELKSGGATTTTSVAATKPARGRKTAAPEVTESPKRAGQKPAVRRSAKSRAVSQETAKGSTQDNDEGRDEAE